MESGEIPEVNIKASWEFRINPATKARLNGQAFWSALSSVEEPWIQADIGYQTYVSGVVTQGGGDGRYRHSWYWNYGRQTQESNENYDWVTEIKVSTFSVSNNDSEVFIKDEHGENIMVSKVVFKKL